MAIFKIYFLILLIYTLMLKNFLKKNNNQIIRFIISGLTASTINFLIYSAIYLITKNIIFASYCGYLIGILLSFIFAKIWVFQYKSTKRIVQSFFIFCLIYFLGGLEMSLIIFFIDGLMNDYKIAWFFGALTAAINNYLGSKYFLFRK